MTRSRIAVAFVAGLGAVAFGAWRVFAPGEAPSPSAESPPLPPETTEEEPVVATEAGLRIEAPEPPQEWEVPEWAPQSAVPEDFEGALAMAYQFAAPVFQRPGEEPAVIGIVRRGTAIPVRGRAFGPGCERSWYEVEGGYVCSAEGFAVGPSPNERPQRMPDLTSALPFQYAMVSERGAPKLYRLPLEQELEDLAAGATPEHEPEVLVLRMVGDYFVARDTIEEGPGGEWQRTVRGHYVHRDALEDLTMPTMVGARLGAERTLPMAFVFGEERPLYRIEDGELAEVGVAEKYARFEVAEEVTIDGRTFVVRADGLALARDAVRVARRSEPDERVESDTYIHIDLDEQVLVAYEGGAPVYATLVSSGKEGYDTPRGVFRIDKKFLSVTMSGEDPHDGPYEVEEVPWTMYYWESYALHGAYWHDDFGKVRSHGCTNLSPPDARWLFEWSAPELPAGWHGYNARRGTWVQFTRASQGDV